MIAKVRAILLCSVMSRFVAMTLPFACSSAMAITYYQLNDGITMTEETVGDVTYYRTSEGDEFPSVTLNDNQNPHNDIYRDYLNKKTPPVEIDRVDVLRFWRDKSGNQVSASRLWASRLSASTFGNRSTSGIDFWQINQIDFRQIDFRQSINFRHRLSAN